MRDMQQLTLTLAPFVKELRGRTRRLMEDGEGLEKTAGMFWAQSTTQGGPRRMQ
jgi:hypothetical protein